MPHGPPAPPVLYAFADPDELVKSLATFILKAQHEGLEKRGHFTLAISGGSLPKQLKGLIGHPDVQWDKWCVAPHT